MKFLAISLQGEECFDNIFLSPDCQKPEPHGYILINFILRWDFFKLFKKVANMIVNKSDYPVHKF